jgi:GntR family transcriptional regulator
MSETDHQLRADHRPLYLQAVDALYGLLEEGTFGPGDTFPSVEELSKRLGVSRSTIREAISHLEKDGLVVRKQGSGTYVAGRSGLYVAGGLERLQSFRTLAKLAGRQAYTAQREVSMVPATPESAELLHLPVESELARVRVVEAIDNCRVAYLDSLISAALVDFEALTGTTGSLLDYLIEQVDLPLSYAQSQVYAISADRELAGELQVAEGRSVLQLVETLYSTTDQPISLSRNYFLTECFHFNIVRRIVRKSRSL